MKKYHNSQKGFTLIEIIVAVGIFVIVIMVAIGAVLSAVDANRKAQSMNVVVNNLNLTFESMLRDIRTGSNYDDACPVGSGGDACVVFTDREGREGVSYVYYGDEGYIEKTSTDPNVLGTGTITSGEVVLEHVSFEVKGNGNGLDDGPERMLLNVRGVAGTGDTQSRFNIQTLVTSRYLDVEELD